MANSKKEPQLILKFILRILMILQLGLVYWVYKKNAISFRDIVKLLNKYLKDARWDKTMVEKRSNQLQQIGFTYPLEYLLFDFARLHWIRIILMRDYTFRMHFIFLDYTSPLTSCYL